MHPYTQRPAGLDPAPRSDARRDRCAAPAERLQEIPGIVPPLFSPAGRAAPSRRAAPSADDKCRQRPYPAYEEKRNRPTGPPAGIPMQPWSAHDRHRASRCAGGTSSRFWKSRDLKKHFPVKKGLLAPHASARCYAVDGISFTINEGETLGPGGRVAAAARPPPAATVLRLIEPTSGVGQGSMARRSRSSRSKDRVEALSAGKCRSSSRIRILLAQPAHERRRHRRPSRC